MRKTVQSEKGKSSMLALEHAQTSILAHETSRNQKKRPETLCRLPSYQIDGPNPGNGVGALIVSNESGEGNKDGKSNDAIAGAGSGELEAFDDASDPAVVVGGVIADPDRYLRPYFSGVLSGVAPLPNGTGRCGVNGAGRR